MQCKEDLVSKLICDKGYMWNPITCSCECAKYCEAGQYLDYRECACRKKLTDDLIEQCTTVVDLEIGNSSSLLVDKAGSSSNIYLFLFITVLIIASLSTAGSFYYFKKVNSKKFEDKIYEIAYSNTGTLNY